MESLFFFRRRLVVKHCLVMFMAFVLFSGCGEISSSKKDSTASTGSRTFSYLLTESGTGPHKISGFEIVNEGGLVPLEFNPIEMPSSNMPWDLASDPLGRYLALAYTNTSGRFVSLYSINSQTGAITLKGVPYQLTGETSNVTKIHDMVFHPNGKFLFVRGDKIHTFSITETGELNLVETPTVVVDGIISNYNSQMVIHPDKGILYVSSRGQGFPGEIHVFSINSDTGALTRIPGEETSGGFATGEINSYALSLDSTNNRLYIGENIDNEGIRGRPINTNGSLGTQILNTPTSGINNSKWLAFSKNKQHLLSSSGGGIRAYAYDASSGSLTLTPQATFSLGDGDSDFYLHPESGFFYVSVSTYNGDTDSNTAFVKVIELDANGIMSTDSGLDLQLSDSVIIQMAEVVVNP